MGHLFADLDFVVTAFIVSRGKVLLVHHRKLDGWFAPGGHIELGETTDEALFREIKEETGLDPVDDLHFLQSPRWHRRKVMWSGFDQKDSHNAAVLLTPWAVETHDFYPLPGHRHLCFCYLACGFREEVILEEKAHDNIMWFGPEAIQSPHYALTPPMQEYALQAIKEVARAHSQG